MQVGLYIFWSEKGAISNKIVI